MSEKKRYEFEVKVWANLSVVASSRKAAWAAVEAALGAVSVTGEIVAASSAKHGDGRVVAISLSPSDEPENNVPYEVTNVECG